MLYFKIKDGRVVSVSDVFRNGNGENWISRHDFKDMAFAESIAAQMSTLTDVRYIATDAGDSVRPRFDVIKAPTVGDKISYTFNGDSYSDGMIESISASMKVIVSSTGNKYYRKRLTGNWKLNKTWSMIPGHHNDRNPSF